MNKRVDVKLFFSCLEHSRARGLRPDQDVGDGQLRAGDAGTAQGQQNIKDKTVFVWQVGGQRFLII